jgi:hypothetical protein
MASNVAAVDLMKQSYQVIISWQVLNLKMKKYYGIKGKVVPVINAYRGVDV